MSCIIEILSEDSLRRIRHVLADLMRRDAVRVPMQHLEEAAAAACGFGTHAALLSAIRHAGYDPARFAGRLDELEPGKGWPEWWAQMDSGAWQPDLPLSSDGM